VVWFPISSFLMSPNGKSPKLLNLLKSGNGQSYSFDWMTSITKNRITHLQMVEFVLKATINETEGFWTTGVSLLMQCTVPSALTFVSWTKSWAVYNRDRGWGNDLREGNCHKTIVIILREKCNIGHRRFSQPNPILNNRRLDFQELFSRQSFSDALLCVMKLSSNNVNVLSVV
jgi:hypothetical protein